MNLKSVLVLVVSYFSIANSVEIRPYVVNGTGTTIDQFPSLASLRFDDEHSCGSTIINELWILTAAHCVIGDDPKNLSVYIESTFIDDPNPNKILVESYIIHEEYTPSNSYINDIALVKLQRPLQSKLFNWKVKLAPKGSFYPTGTHAVLAGWGYLVTDGRTPNILQAVDLQIYASADCAKRHSKIIHPTHICGGVEGGYKGQCSGGPIFVRGVQVGIVSWSVKPCASRPYPGVFTSVAHYIDWIEEKIESELGLNSFVSA